MKKQDLKDGMVVTYRNGQKRYVINGLLFELFNEETKVYRRSNRLKSYSDDLTCDSVSNGNLDIVKVEYDGETLWKIQEYVTFDEARRSGKRFKHKNWVAFIDLKEVLKSLSYGNFEKINRMLDEKCWIIEQ